MADGVVRSEVQSDDKLDSDVAEELPVDRRPSNDPELEDLLEDALQDFDKPNVACPANKTHCTSIDVMDNRPCNVAAGTHSEATAAASSQSSHAPPPDIKGMESLIMSLMSGDTSLLSQQLEGLDLGLNDSDIPEAASASGIDFTETLQRTLGDLAQSTQDLQHDDLSEEELMQFMSSLGGDGIDGHADGGGDDELLPMMHGMMKSLLSKDVLYPSLKDISTQYPAWLETNRDKISHEEFNRYDRQYRLMSSIVQEFEAEKPTDEDEVQRRRFERVLEIMQQMQALGHPPKDLVGDMPKDMPVDEDGLPKLPAGLPSPDQCTVM
jgi:peroxin-19